MLIVHALRHGSLAELRDALIREDLDSFPVDVVPGCRAGVLAYVGDDGDMHALTEGDVRAMQTAQK